MARVIVVKNNFKKGLVVGIIVLFIGVSVLSSVSSKDISNSDKEILEYDIELEDNNEIEPAENYEEIITYIDGSCNEQWTKRRFIIFKEVRLSAGSHGTLLHIHGWRKPGWERFNVINVEYIHAPLFFGKINYIGYPVATVDGIALGNIEWS